MQEPQNVPIGLLSDVKTKIFVSDNLLWEEVDHRLGKVIPSFTY